MGNFTYPDWLNLGMQKLFVRDRWMGDLSSIPFGKVIEFMQSFAEQFNAGINEDKQ